MKKKKWRVAAFARSVNDPDMTAMRIADFVNEHKLGPGEFVIGNPRNGGATITTDVLYWSDCELTITSRG